MYVNRPFRKQAFQRPIYIQKPDDFRHPAFQLAESEGFKPPIPERGIPDFESSAIDHSANLPISEAIELVRLAERSEGQLIIEPSLKSDAKVLLFSDTTKENTGNLQKLFERELCQFRF